MGPSIEAKLARIRSGEQPRLLDLFSGCGGLALGFVTAGCKSVGGVELDEDAARSYAWNFHRQSDDTPDGLQANPKDILKVEPQALLKDLRWRTEEKGVDLIVGGPPCPAFTRVGRAKLREVKKDPEAFKNDPRAKLYVRYLKYVKELRPLALVMENVPDVLNWGGHNLGDEICEALGRNYRCAYTLLNAADYGVPQMRERFFLVAIHKALALQPRFPVPTHRGVLPPGYSGTRNVALKNIPTHGSAERTWYQPRLKPTSDARPWVTVKEALADLPPLTDHIHGLDRRGARRLDGKLDYGERPPSDYAQLMKEWPGFETAGYLRDHVTRCLTWRDYRLFEHMNSGDDYPKAYALAEELFRQETQRCIRMGEPLPLRAKYIPPYDPSKFPNKWRKMAADEPARTLMAHLGKDTYSHIHYDSEQKRVISVREAARLQSFPDGFRFSGTMNPAFRQIGNSVPPLLSWAIAHELLSQLGANITNPFPEYKQEPQCGRPSKARVA
jgi:DNA (cytosine-5)-methyltransferase 1